MRQVVATASGDKSLKLWALADGSCLRTFEGHTASVLRLAFLSSGTQVTGKTCLLAPMSTATADLVVCLDLPLKLNGDPWSVL